MSGGRENKQEGGHFGRGPLEYFIQGVGDRGGGGQEVGDTDIKC